MHTIDIATKCINKHITVVETTPHCISDDLNNFMKKLNDIFNGYGTVTTVINNNIYLNIYIFWLGYSDIT